MPIRTLPPLYTAQAVVPQPLVHPSSDSLRCLWKVSEMCFEWLATRAIIFRCTESGSLPLAFFSANCQTSSDTSTHSLSAHNSLLQRIFSQAKTPSVEMSNLNFVVSTQLSRLRPAPLCRRSCRSLSQCSQLFAAAQRGHARSRCKESWTVRCQGNGNPQEPELLGLKPPT